MSGRFRLRIPWAISSVNSRRPKKESDGEAPQPAFLWENEENWLVISPREDGKREKIDSEDGEEELFPPLSLRHCRRRRKNDRPNRGSHASVSSADSHWFSSDSEKEEAEGETELVMASSRSVSTDDSSPPIERLKTEPLLKESVAVVKKSEDPYWDFRSSMAEMIIENDLYEEEELEQLLQSLLVLNSKQHHPAIVLAFSDVWAAIFDTT
ncbi:uncharacterized protein LOC144702290 [Wolffia australiana]